jgi:hypothetical protein
MKFRRSLFILRFRLAPIIESIFFHGHCRMHADMVDKLDEGGFYFQHVAEVISGEWGAKECELGVIQTWLSTHFVIGAQ